MSKQDGFHLLEILITLALIAILATLSLPLYTTHLVHTRRLAAEAMLTKLAIALEQYQIAHNEYEGATLTNLQFPEKIIKNNYQLAIASTTASEYLITATPLGKQAEKDVDCQVLMLNEKSEQGISGGGTVEECW